MTTYLIPGLRFEYPATGDPALFGATLEFVFEDGADASLSYTFQRPPDATGALARVEFTVPNMTYGYLDGLDVANVFTGLFGYIDWGEDKSSAALLLNYTDPASGTQAVWNFNLAGDAYPEFANIEEAEAFDDLVTELGALTAGPLGPSTPIAVASLADVIVVEEDLIAGTDAAERVNSGVGNDEIETFGGNDTIDAGDGDDLVDGGLGSDRIIGGAGNDQLHGGQGEGDLRDVIFGGDGNDSIIGGYGNDELRGDAGNDSIAGGFGADTVIGGEGNDTLTGSAFGDVIFGGGGDDFINGGFGSDRLNGGTFADRFFHLGIADHGSDWIQDYNRNEGDVLVFGGAGATSQQFQINIANTANAGDANVDEVFIIYRPTEQILWALVDGAGQERINLQLGDTFLSLDPTA